MSEHIKHDIEVLKEIVGDEITPDDLAFLTKNNPNIFYTLLMKIFEMLVYLSNIPVDPNDDTKTINLYEEAFNRILEAEKIKNDGKIPTWMQVAQTIFTFAKHIKDR